MTSYASLPQGFNPESIDPWGFPDSSVGKESTCSAVDPSSIPGLGRSPGEGIGYPLQYSWTSLVAQLGLISGLRRSSGEGKGYPLQYSWTSLVAQK